MKKINKIVAGLMVLGMGTGVAGALPLQSFKTVSAQETADFSVAGFKTELKIGEDVTLPAESTGVTRTVIDPMGNVVTLTDNKLEALKLGTYTVRYVKDIQNSDGKIVQEYKVKVTGDKTQITFESNNERIIPETVNLGKTVVLPIPTAMVNGEEVAEAEREKAAVITKASGELEASKNLSLAAKELSNSPGALHLRTLSTINDVSSDQSNTIIFAIPIEVMNAFGANNVLKTVEQVKEVKAKTTKAKKQK